MNKIFETHVNRTVVDFYTETAARAAVEDHGEGYVVTFIRGFDKRDRSCAMNVYKDGAWRGFNIHE